MPVYPQFALQPRHMQIPTLALGQLPRPQYQRQPSYSLTPEEEESLLGSIGQASLSGLGTVAHTLGKPGAAVRGTISGLTGGPWGGGLLNLIPFSNTLGITDPEKWVYSRDIMRRHGLVGRRDNWGNFAAGLVGDIATDPLSYVSFGAGGAATKGGQLLHKAGLSQFLPDVLQATAKGGRALGPRVGGMRTTLDDFLKNLPKPVRDAAPEKIRIAAEAMGVDAAQLGNQPLRGLMGVHAPMMPSKQFAVLGKGGRVAETLGTGMDWLGQGVRYSAPVRALAAGFSPAMRRTTSEVGQRTAASASRLEAFRKGASREELAGHITRLNEVGALKTGEAGIQDAVAMRDFMEQGTALPSHLQGKGVEKILGDIRNFQAKQLAEEQALGMATKDLDDAFNYVSRYAHKFGVGKRSRAALKALGAGHPSQISRMEFFRGVPSRVLDDMTMDPEISGTLSSAKPGSWFGKTGPGGVDLEAAVQHIKTKYGVPKGLTEDDLYRQAKWLSELDPQHVEKGIPVFPHHPIFDVVQRDEFSKHAVANAEAAYKLLAQEARHFKDLPAGTYKTLAEVMEAAKLTGDAAPGVMFMRLPKDLRSRLLGGTNSGAPIAKLLEEIRIPGEVADAITAMQKGFTSPEWMQGFVKGFDNFTNWFRAHVTTYFPAFVNRNLVSGQIQNALAGAYGPGAANMYRAMRDAQVLLRGKGVIPGVLEFPVIKALAKTDPRYATDAELATRKIAELAFAHRLGGKAMMESAAHLGGQAASSPAEILSQMPGLSPWSVRSAVKASVRPEGGNPGWWNPLKVRGVGETMESQFVPSRLGEEASYWVESMNRLGPFTEMLRKGIDPAAAAERIKLLQVDYMAAASGDAMMRRLIPFWAFLKGQSQYLAKELTTHPGGALSQAIQLEGRGHEDLPAFTPQHVQTSAAIPGGILPEGIFGKPPEDSVRAVTGFGLMHEDPLQALALDPRKPISSLAMGALREGMGRMNPLLQMPIEAATGKSLYQSGPRGGRDLQDMDPALGRLFANVTGSTTPVQLPWGTETAGRMIAPRWITTAKGVTDTRKNLATKLLNAMTGVRITDVSPRAREAEMREAIQELQSDLGGRAFEVRWIPKDIRAKMSEEELAQAEHLELLSKILGERAKRRAAKELVMEN